MPDILPEYQIKSLPSKFLPYPKDAEVSVKPYTFGAAMNLQIAGTTPQDVYKNILEGVKCNFPKNLLTPQDVIFLGVYRKLISTKHDKITIKSLCPNCATQTETHKTLKDLKFAEPKFKKLPIEVELDDYIIYFNTISTKDFLECINKYKGEPLSMLTKQVVKIEKRKVNKDEDGKETFIFEEMKFKNDEERFKEIRYILGSRVDEDRDTLDEVANILQDYGLKPITIECSDEFCKHEYEVRMEDKDVLVYPFRDSTKSTRSRIKLGDE